MGTSAFRHQMQTRFGDGGRGFVSIGRPWKTYVQEGVRGYMSDEFEPEKTHLKNAQSGGEGCYGLLGVDIAAQAPGARAWSVLAPRFSHVELAYWQGPRVGSFDVFVDGAKAGRIATRAAQPGSGFFGFDVTDAPHQVEVRAVGDGEVRVFGMTLDRAQAGVVVDALGINGAQIFTPLHWNEEHFAEQVRHRAPDLVVLAYGTNEALDGKLDDPTYEQGLVDLLGRVSRAAPGASCMLLGPPDLARWTKGTRGYHTSPRILEIEAIQRRVSRAAGCAFFSQIDAMGGPGSMAAWAEEQPEPRAQGDRVHLTRTGYAQVGTALATDVLRAYDAVARRKWACPRPEPTRPGTWPGADGARERKAAEALRTQRREGPRREESRRGRRARRGERAQKRRLDSTIQLRGAAVSVSARFSPLGNSSLCVLCVLCGFPSRSPSGRLRASFVGVDQRVGEHVAEELRRLAGSGG